MSLDDRNRKLNKKIVESDLSEAVAVLIKDSKKRKRNEKILAFSIAIDILLTVGLAVVSVNTHSIATKAENNQQAIVRSCETSNEARANNKQLWSFALSLPAPNAPTVEQQANRDRFAAFVDKTFAPRDCSKVVQ